MHSYQIVFLLLVFFATLNDRLEISQPSSSNNIRISPVLFNCSLQTTQHHMLLRAPKRCMTGHLMYLFSLLILNASDCQPNPGPRTVKYPCGICGKACVWSRNVRSVACSNCDQWFHKNCLNMPTVLYEPLEQTDISWYCCGCGLPNFNTSLFEDFDISDPTCSTPSQTSFSSVNTEGSIGLPDFTSSPTTHRNVPLSKKKARILVINFQSIRSKRESFWAMLEYSDPDIILATETWLNPTIAEREVLPANYKFVARKDRPNSSHGGVAIIAKHDLDASEVDTPATSEFVAVSLNCKDLKKPIILGCMYRPTDNKADYTQDLCNAVSDLSSRFKDHIIWLGGDTNLPDIDWNTDTITGHNYLVSINKAYIDTFNHIGCEQMVNFPTRVNNILDIFCTNRPSLVDRISTVPGLSDHDIVLVDTNILPARQKPVKRKIFLWKRADKSSMSDDLKQFTAEFVHANSTNTEVNTLWTTFKQTCIESVNKYVPSKYTSTRFNQPWCNRDVRRQVRKKRRAYKKARISKNPDDWTRYKKIQKDAQNTCRDAHNNYIRNMVSEPGSKNKKLYSYIKGMKCDSSGVATLKKDGTNYSEASDKAEILNDQFASVFTREDCSNIPSMGNSLKSEAPPLVIQENGVKKILEGLNPHKASGPDEISSRFLKEMASSISPALTLIFQASYDQGTVPSDWKGAFITPLFKKGDKSKASNYRPVSLTSICSKAMEHIVQSHLMKYLDSHHILSDQQHGFRKRRSCESQLITTIHDLASGLDKRQQVDAILLDFSKAFDKVAHQRLAAKLHHYGIRNKTLSWIQSFLADRYQKVVLDGKTSSSSPVTSGVPQGTVLGPLLFLIYINDLPSRVSSTARLFADDCLLYRVISSQDDVASLQEDLDRLQEWERDWQMSFNPDKCEHIRITLKRKIVQSTYKIHGQVLKETTKAKYLGVTIDKNLSWNSHIDMVTKRANQTSPSYRGISHHAQRT